MITVTQIEAWLLIAQDKANHAIYGEAAFGLTFALTKFLGHAPTARAAGAGLLVAAAVGAVKEWVIDLQLRRRQLRLGQVPTHDVDVFDFVATSAGGLAGCLIGLGGAS